MFGQAFFVFRQHIKLKKYNYFNIYAAFSHFRDLIGGDS